MAIDLKTGDCVRTSSGLIGTIASIVQLTAFVTITQNDVDTITPCLLSELTRIDSPDDLAHDAELVH